MTNKEIQAQVEVLKQEINKLEELAKKPKKFEFNFPKGKTYFVGEGQIYAEWGGYNSEYLQHGRYRLTEEGAKLSLERNRKANRLEMLAEYLGGLKEFVSGEENWHLHFDPNTAEYKKESSQRYYDPVKVYMTKEVATQVTDILNREEYEL